MNFKGRTMSFRALPIDDTLVAKVVALAALGLIALILFGLGRPAHAADQSMHSVRVADAAPARCSHL
jgi:hypothetical protein